MLTGLIVTSRRIVDPRLARIARVFGWLYLAPYGLLLGMGLLLVAAEAPEGVQAATSFLVLLSINLLPLLWLRIFFVDYARSVLPQAEDVDALAAFHERHAISPREQEVIAGVLKGLTNKEIAGTLHISAHTVKNHLYKVYQKLGIKTRHQLVGLVARSGEERDRF